MNTLAPKVGVPGPAQAGADGSSPEASRRVEYVFIHRDTEEIRKLQTKIKILERERDMWRNRAFAKR